MTDPELGEERGGGENGQSQHEKYPPTTADEIDDPDDSKISLINGNGAAGIDDHDDDVQIHDPAAASSDGEVSFNGLGKDEVMKYADEPFWKRLRMALFVIFWCGWLAMLATAVVIIALAPRCPPRANLKWYQTDSIYHILPESFKDSDGNGYGDFEGLKSKMSYIDGLGSNAVWLSNIYMTDGSMYGHGIVDHKETNTKFDAKSGSFKAWLKKLSKAGKKVILDLVPNQTSKKHQWFVKSVKKEGKYTNYYIWDQTQPDSGDSKNVWTKDPVRGEWYLNQHKDFGDFAVLNLTNPDVVDEIKDIMKFWLNAGVGGFHINDVELVTKNMNDSKDFLADLRLFVDGFNKPGRERFLFGTVKVDDKSAVKSYYGDGKKAALHIVRPHMETFNSSSTAKTFETVARQILFDDVQQWLGLWLGDQFTSRIASRFGKKDFFLNAGHAMQLLMPGTPFTYYGDEYGQLNGDDSNKTDKEHWYSPMQWNNERNAGFTSGKPWQKVNKEYQTNNVQAAEAHFTDYTPLKVYKDLVELRQQPSFQWGKTMVHAPSESLFMFSRKATRFPFYVTIINLGSTDETVSLVRHTDHVASKAEGTVSFHSTDPSQVGQKLNFHERPVALKAGEVLVVEFEADE